jgi:hypothetical protein
MVRGKAEIPRKIGNFGIVWNSQGKGSRTLHPGYGRSIDGHPGVVRVTERVRVSKYPLLTLPVVLGEIPCSASQNSLLTA